MRTIIRGLVVGGLLLGAAGIASAKCDPANVSSDATSVSNARTAADNACVCGNFTSHGAYVSCAAPEINSTLDGSDADHNRSCRGKAKKCYAKSTCGKSAGSVTCYKTNAHGKTTCSPKPDCGHCVAPAGGSVCCGSNASCCDACVPVMPTVVVAPNGSLTFSPQNLTINAGETVQWVWEGSGHNVISGSGCASDGQFCSPNDTNCASAPVSMQGATYTHTFTTPGTYPYYCSVHCGGFSMTGTITVQ